MKKQQRIYNAEYLLGLYIVVVSMFVPQITNAQTAQDSEYYNQWGRYSRELENNIDDLDDDRVDEFPMPVLFGVTPDKMTSNFGDPRSGGRSHEGQDIMSPRGTPIVSPTEAVVIRTGFGASAGYYVYTANPGRETFVYMHLDSIADIESGDELSVGDLIGYVGSTGNAIASAPHLHFEIHDDEDGAIDPFPRITRIFPVADKIKYLEEILDDADDEKALAQLLVNLYSREFSQAESLGITLPSSIANLRKLVVSTPVTPSAPTTPIASTVVSGNLTLGSRGPAVVALQKYLISKNVGSASRIVADGSFGPITKAALADFQRSIGITPAIGYYGPLTRAYVTAHP